ncbi:2-keto-4-pentenoate hydratase [Streptomyces sp. NPDC059477]|uniref:2-keto-4-pentenoate hydratase n=1 Tax=Streptomyces sp. NPDC059477 TaxID=3346847 RepID=UPI0036C1DDC6
MRGNRVTGQPADALINRVADRLHEAHRTGVAVPPVRDEFPDADVASAYAVQRRNTERWVAEGRRRVGYKIGLTSAAVQRQLGVSEPDFGTLFADMAFADGAELDPGSFIAPRAEAEVALVLDRDLDLGRHTVADVIRATAFALPALEIVDSRIAGWDIALVDTVADNGSSGAFVLGTVPVPLTAVDLRSCAMTLTRHGETVSEGKGTDCLGHPLTAAVWLADTLGALGTPLRAGDIVLTGALGPMTGLDPLQSLTAHITGLGRVSVRTGK